MKRPLSAKLVAALLGLLAIPSGMAMAADATIRPAVYTHGTGTPAPTTTLDLPMQIPSTLNLPTQISNTPAVTTVGWRHYGYRPYYAPYAAHRPYVVAPYVAYRPYYYPAPYYGYAAGVYPGYGAAYYRGPGPYYGYRGRYGW